jgi:hypothetical protein
MSLHAPAVFSLQVTHLAAQVWVPNTEAVAVDRRDDRCSLVSSG